MPKNNQGGSENRKNNSGSAELQGTALNVAGDINLTAETDSSSSLINFTDLTATAGFIKYNHLNNKFTFNTASSDRVTMDSTGLTCNTLNSSVMQSGTNVEIKHDTELMAKFVGDGAAQLYYDSVKKFETDSSGTTTIGTCNINGGTGFAVIEMGGDSGAFIDMKAPAGDDHDVRLRTYADGQFQISGFGGSGTSSETMANFHYNGAVELYHDGTLRLKTAAKGINVTPEGSAPANNATGTAGDIALHGDYVYVCTDTDTWKRAALNSY